MRRSVPLVLAGALLGPLMLGGCDKNLEMRGFAPTPGSLEKLELKTQSREDVVRLIGSPSSVATFNPNVWYYISSKQEQFAFFKQTTISQSVLQLNFDEGGRLQTQKSYDLADAKDITMVARITPTTGKELTVLEQILGNVGRFSGPRQDSNPGAPTGGI